MGVPAIMPWHGWDWVDGGKEAGEAAWRAKFGADYHKPSDEWTPEWVMDAAAMDVNLLYLVGRDLADSREWPAWNAGAEFEAARQASAAARAE